MELGVVGDVVAVVGEEDGEFDVEATWFYNRDFHFFLSVVRSDIMHRIRRKVINKCSGLFILVLIFLVRVNGRTFWGGGHDLFENFIHDEELLFFGRFTNYTLVDSVIRWCHNKKCGVNYVLPPLWCSHNQRMRKPSKRNHRDDHQVRG